MVKYRRANTHRVGAEDAADLNGRTITNQDSVRIKDIDIRGTFANQLAQELRLRASTNDIVERSTFLESKCVTRINAKRIPVKNGRAALTNDSA